MKLTKPLIVLDLETTGFWVDKDKIIEIAMIKFYPDGRKEIFHKKVNPGIPIPPVVSQLTGIKDADVKNAPAFSNLANETVEFLKGCDLAGFNIEKFDIPILTRELEQVGCKFNWTGLQFYDAQKIYHLNERRDLTAAYKFFCQKDLQNAHSALQDAEATAEILSAQVEKYSKDDDSIESLRKFDYEAKDQFYEKSRRFRWWNGKLYMMFGKYAKQYSLQEIARKDSGYLEWVLSADFSPEVKELVADALKGIFPTPEKANKVDPAVTEDQIELF